MASSKVATGIKLSTPLSKAAQIADVALNTSITTTAQSVLSKYTGNKAGEYTTSTFLPLPEEISPIIILCKMAF